MFKKQSKGVTLIETVAALFILTMGISSVVGTAIYSFSVHGKILYRLTALELSREGIEVVRNIRDSNWLPNNTIDNCNDIATGQKCHSNWLNNIPNSCLNGCQVDFNPTTGNWSLTQTNNYTLYLQPDSTYQRTVPSGGSNSVLYRKVTVTKNTAAPFTAQNPEVLVTS
ncbi:MAG TPA: hypothetical protein VEA37_00985, partial [Flavobacterium sp.]|nr:hypothetical protein [Flavobacterium sp.]